MWGLAAPGLVADAISYVKMCELSELSELSVLLLRFRRGGSVRLKRLMRHKPPFRDGKTAFPAMNDGLPPAAGPVSGYLCAKLSKICLS